MKKFLWLIISVKSLAAMIFSGLICAYFAGGWLYEMLSGADFAYALPLLFAAADLALALYVAAIWELLFVGGAAKGLRNAARLPLFAALLLAAFGLCRMLIGAMPSAEARLWLLVCGVFCLALFLLAALAELHFKRGGKRYTVGLREYQQKINARHDGAQA